MKDLVALRKKYGGYQGKSFKAMSREDYLKRRQEQGIPDEPEVEQEPIVHRNEYEGYDIDKTDEDELVSIGVDPGIIIQNAHRDAEHDHRHDMGYYIPNNPQHTARGRLYNRAFDRRMRQLYNIVD